MFVRRALAAALLLTLVPPFLLACGGKQQPDIVIVTIDTLRADRVGAYGYAPARTPVIDRLAHEGVLFEQASTPVPTTLPAHASMLTAELPSRHGIRNNLIYALSDEAPTLAERLRAKGYRTGAFVSAAPLAAHYGLDRGFDAYDDEMPGTSATAFEFPERPATQTVRRALDWVRSEVGQRPMLLWVHFFEPHAPYLPPAPFAGQFEHPYDGEVAASDAALGQLLESLDRLRDRQRITLVTSDHGEGLGEHGEDTHSFFVYETTVRIPLVVHAPGRWEGGRRVAEPVSLLDVGPTVLALAGVKASLGPDGIALDPDAIPRRRLLIETLATYEGFGWSPMFALREGSQKVIRSARSRAFDLIADPGERRDLLDSGAVWPNNLLEALDNSVMQSNPAGAALGMTRQPTAAEAQALAALGYAGGAATVGEASSGAALLEAIRTRPEGTARLDELAKIQQAQTSIEANQPGAAIAPLREVVQANPQNGWAYSLLAESLRSVGEIEAAADAFERAAAVQPLRREHFLAAARLRRQLGNADDAVVWYERALDLTPIDLSLLREATSAFAAAERLDRALARLEIAIELGDPDADHRADLLALMAATCLQVGQTSRAQPHLERARKLRDSPVLIVLHGQMLAAQSRWHEVNELFTPLSIEHSRDARAVELKAMALEQLGERTRALQLYTSAVALDDRLDTSYARMARLLLSERLDPEGALSSAVRALELAREKPEHHVLYVSVLETIGETERAREHLRTWLPRFSTHQGLKVLAGRLEVKVPGSE